MSLLGYSQATVVQYIIGICEFEFSGFLFNSSCVTISLLIFLLYNFSRSLCIFFLAKQASSSADVLSKLEAFGFPSSTETQSFALEIFAKVPRKASGGLNVSFSLFLFVSF
jgi:pre-mRNA-splicing factor ATP-dependent RNA helicase DHX16